MSAFMNEDQVKANITYTQLFKKLWPYCRRHPWMLLVASLCVIGFAAGARFLNYLIGQAIDQGFLKQDYNYVIKIALLFLALEVLLTLFMFGSQFLFQRFGNQILFYIREDLIRHLQSLPIQYFNKTPVGRIVTRVTNDVANLGDLFTDGVINVITEFVVLIAIVVAMLLISPKLTFYVLISAPLFVYVSFAISEKIREILRLSKMKLSELNSFLAENINGIKVVQLYNRVPKNRLIFQKFSAEYAFLTNRSIKAYALMVPVMNVFTAATLTLALYYGGLTSIEGSLPIGLLVTFILHTQDFVYPLREILEKYQQFQNSLTSAERVFQIFDVAPEVTAPTDSHLKLQGDIHFKSLNFRYDSHLPFVLKNLNLQIRNGESIAIVGRTGSGKSTLISLLQGFYPAPEGSLLISGKNIEEIPKPNLRNLVGVVQQDNFIFRGSIAQNISLNDPRITEERMLNACREIGYLDLLQRTGRDLKSKVEERGANLSVGERQLVSFARILAYAPQILILDEATANVDSATERIIQQATQKICEGRTSLIIAHRLSTIRQCNRIVVLDQGEIREVGSHEELLAKRGLYFEFHSRGHIDEEKDQVPSAGL